MANYIKSRTKPRYQRTLVSYIYRHPQTGKIIVAPDQLNNEAVHRMGVKLIAAHCIGGE